MTRIDSAIFDDGWRESRAIADEGLEWPGTGERLTADSFVKYRKQGGMVISHTIPQDAVDAAVSSPLTMIASDRYLKNGKGHPRTAGTYSRVLGRYVRDLEAISILEAVRKMALMPALRLEDRAPMMRKKGRLQVGSDADLVVFDPARVIDNSTCQQPATPPDGIRYVLVNGVPVVTDGLLVEDVSPGQGVRAPVGR